VRATQGLFMTDSWVRVFRAERKESSFRSATSFSASERVLIADGRH